MLSWDYRTPPGAPRGPGGASETGPCAPTMHFSPGFSGPPADSRFHVSLIFHAVLKSQHLQKKKKKVSHIHEIRETPMEMRYCFSLPLILQMITDGQLFHSPCIFKGLAFPQLLPWTPGAPDKRFATGLLEFLRHIPPRGLSSQGGLW